VLASVTTRNKEEEMPVQKYVIELMGQSTKLEAGKRELSEVKKEYERVKRTVRP
jgi:hypothetical protein